MARTTATGIYLAVPAADATEPLWNEHALPQPATVVRLVPTALRPFTPEEVASFVPLGSEHDVLMLTIPDSLDERLYGVTELVQASAGRSHLWSEGGLLTVDNVRRWAFHKGIGRLWALPSVQTLAALHRDGAPSPLWPSDRQTGESPRVLDHLDPPYLSLVRRLAPALGASVGNVAIRAISAALIDAPGRWTVHAMKEWQTFTNALDDLALTATLDWAQR
jgi:hypothetical protein